MPDILPNIRNAVRALILRDNKVLLLKKEDSQGSRFALPGGGQEPGESLTDTLIRECEEELGCVVEVNELLHVVDYLRERNNQPPSVRHLVEFLFICEVPADYVAQNGAMPDQYQVDVVWADLDELRHFPVIPKSLVVNMVSGANLAQQVYLGVVKKGDFCSKG